MAVEHHALTTIADLRLDPRNPRKISREAAEGLGYSLESFGDLSGIVWNQRTGELVAGHQRVEQLRQRGAQLLDGALQIASGERFPVRVVDWPKSKQTAANIAANNPHIGGEFTPELVPLLEEVKLDIGEDAFETLALDMLTDEIGGFGAGHEKASARVQEWKNADNFFDMPAWLAPTWEKASHVVVIYSGGKDSTAAAIWAARHKEDRQFLLAFSDPGVEFPGISAHVADVAEHLGGEPVVVKSELDWWQWLRKQGSWPSMLWRPCAAEFVHKPASIFVKKLPPRTTVVLSGSRAEEAVDGSKKTERSDLPSLGRAAKDYQHFAPCFSARKDTLTKVIEVSGVPIWEGYARGFVRTACWCCPAQCGDQALALQRNYPGLAEDIRRWEKRLGPLQPISTPVASFDLLVDRGKRNEERRAAKTARDGETDDAGE